MDNALKALQGVPLRNVEYTALRKDGSRFLAELNVSLVADAEGKPRGFIGTMRDITHHKEVEEALRRSNAELQARNDELDAFARTVAHDLQSPLAFIIGMAELLADEGETVPLAEQQKYLQAIVQHGLKVSRITDELLLLAQVRRGDSGAGTVGHGPYRRRGLAAPGRSGPGLQGRDRPARRLAHRDWATAPWVEEVWVNYLSNALKVWRPTAAPGAGGGRSSPTARCASGCTTTADGLTAEEQGRLFVPFTQLGQARATGYGLGLSIVHRIVEKLGGQVGVESDGANGYHFQLYPAGRTGGRVEPDPFRG